jgi:hypothetical protein
MASTCFEVLTSSRNLKQRRWEPSVSYEDERRLALLEIILLTTRPKKHFVVTGNPTSNFGPKDPLATRDIGRR